jgi:hypothetical protein
MALEERRNRRGGHRSVTIEIALHSGYLNQQRGTRSTS